MILFTSKAYNIIPLIYCTKVVLTEKMVSVSLLIKLYLHWFTIVNICSLACWRFYIMWGLCFLLLHANDCFWLLSCYLWYITINFIFFYGVWCLWYIAIYQANDLFWLFSRALWYITINLMFFLWGLMLVSDRSIFALSWRLQVTGCEYWIWPPCNCLWI